jgi:membrane protease YdiL (CAAX protease family)
MATNTIKLSTAALTLTAVTATEYIGNLIIGRLALSPLLWLGALRLIQTGTIVWIVTVQESELDNIGWGLSAWPEGLKKGAVWSLGFALTAGCAMLVIYLMGHNPLLFVRSPLPVAKTQLTIFFLVGGFIAPVAEELCFRGILYTYFRRWGIILAIGASTAVFVALHATHGLPVTQIVGGIVFALAYEISHNLMVPITIHALGNLAIFSLSLI